MHQLILNLFILDEAAEDGQGGRRGEEQVEVIVVNEKHDETLLASFHLSLEVEREARSKALLE